MRVHPVQHVSLLEPACNDPLSDQAISSSSLVEGDEGTEYVIEDILDARMYYRKLRYLIK